ncbi:MAG: hypothetical protein NC390_05645 [Fusobacterium sp.]|nr:hypothetical protein [Fusobacterium sp.]
MPIDGVQNYNITKRDGTLRNVIAGGVLGVAGGYAAKHIVPLDSAERKNVPYRSIINVARKETNKKMVANYSALSQRTEAQDTFVKMIEEKNFKNSKNIIKDLEINKPDVAKEFKKIVKIADKDSGAVAREYTGAYHKFLKCMRPNAKFVGIGAAVGLLGGAIYNAMTQNRV